MPYHGAYPGNLLKRIDALFSDRQRVLHVFSGMVDAAAFPGDTLDINPALSPTYCVDAETCEGVDLSLYDLVLCDPPYTSADAAIYGTKPIPQRSRRLTQVCSFELTQRLQPYGVDHCRRLWRVGAASVVVPFRASRPWAAAALVGT